MPIFTVPLHEANDCHLPAGSPQGGQFCSGTGRGPLTNASYERGSKRIPEFLKAEVAAAARAGIVTYHDQQPEPVKDIRGELHDPLAKSHARAGRHEYIDAKTGLYTHAKRGRIYLVTRGGEFEPTETIWDRNFGSTLRRKDLTPDMLTNPATDDDIISTFRHEVGHLMDDQFYGTKSTPAQLAREVRAWTYAVEASPDHRVSERMIRNGLESHAYFTLRGQKLLDTEGQRVSSWDREEWVNRRVQQEAKDNFLDEEIAAKARAFTDRVVKSLTRYGAVLRKRGIVRQPEPKYDRYLFSTYQHKVVPGPGRGGGRFV